MQRLLIYALLSLAPMIATGAALYWLGQQVTASDERHAKQQQVADALSRSARTAIALRRSTFGLLRYTMDRNQAWVKTFRTVTQSIPGVLDDLDEICTTKAMRAQATDFAKSLATVVGLGEEVVWVTPLSPGDLCPIRARQLRMALQANIRDVGAEHLAISEMFAADATKPFTFNFLYPLMFVSALTGTCAVLAGKLIQAGLMSEAAAVHAALRQKLRLRNETFGQRTALRDRAAALDAQEREILEGIGGSILLLDSDDKIVRSNSNAKSFLEKLGNPDILFADQLKEAGIIASFEKVELPSGLVLCKISA